MNESIINEQMNEWVNIKWIMSKCWINAWINEWLNGLMGYGINQWIVIEYR